MSGGRVDTGERTVPASPAQVYAALTTAAALQTWLPPKGASGRIEAFEAREGGPFRMILTFADSAHAGKTTAHTDVVDGRFVELLPDERVVEDFEFVSDDPAFSGTMRMRWTLGRADGGTRVRVEAENVPPGIDKSVHERAIASSLDNLSAFLAG